MNLDAIFYSHWFGKIILRKKKQESVNILPLKILNILIHKQGHEILSVVFRHFDGIISVMVTSFLQMSLLVDYDFVNSLMLAMFDG